MIKELNKKNTLIVINFTPAMCVIVMTVFVLTHSKKGVHTFTGVLGSFDEEKPKGIIG